MAEMQTIVAEALGMERGVSSDKQHLSAIQYKNKAEAERLERQKKEMEQLNVAKARKEAAIEAAKTAVDGIKGFFGQSDRDKQIKALTGQINGLQDENRKLAEDGQARERKLLENAKKAHEMSMAKARQETASLKDSLNTAVRQRDEARQEAREARGLLASVWQGAKAAVSAILALAYDDRRRWFSRTEAAAIDNAMGTDNDIPTRELLGSELMRMAKAECPDKLHTGRIEAQKADIQNIARREHEDRSLDRGLRM